MYHIFICDDEKRFTEVLEKLVETCLKEQGQSYEIQIFYNGIEMFQAMQKKAPEILLLDIDMPEISGMELAEQIFSSNMIWYFRQYITSHFVLYGRKSWIRN